MLRTQHMQTLPTTRKPRDLQLIYLVTSQGLQTLSSNVKLHSSSLELRSIAQVAINKFLKQVYTQLHTGKLS
jgi:hypothetical protein